jgi:hypothetical protein
MRLQCESGSLWRWNPGILAEGTRREGGITYIVCKVLKFITPLNLGEWFGLMTLDIWPRERSATWTPPGTMMFRRLPPPMRDGAASGPAKS